MVQGVPDWFDLGLSLGIEEQILIKLCRSRTWDEAYISDMVQYWLSTGRASWKGLADALNRIGEDKAAQKIHFNG